MTNLLKCPFCGGELYLCTYKVNMVDSFVPADDTYMLCCSKCILIVEGFSTSEDAIEYANTRPLEDEATMKERKRCAKIVHDIGFSHTAGLNQYIASEFSRARQLILRESTDG